MRWLLMPMEIGAGSLMVIQAACNSALERAWDRPATVAVISLSIGISVLVVVGFALGQLGLPSGKSAQAPWWAWLGGACGAISLLSQPLAAPRLVPRSSRPFRNGLFHRLCGRRSFWVARLR